MLEKHNNSTNYSVLAFATLLFFYIWYGMARYGIFCFCISNS